jgi:protein-L-isoaspartate O-methyltransferase
MEKPTDPVVLQNNATGRVSYWAAGDNHSAADRNGVSLADYIHAMFGFIVQSKARHVLMIGCGGGNLATMLHRAGVRVGVVDIDAHSFEIARGYFHLPDAVECHVADGAKFLRRDVRYDAIVLDAYTGGKVPKVFLKTSFFDLAKSRLKRGGIFLMNILVKDDDDRTPDEIMRLMKQTWRETRLLDSDGWEDRNAVGMAGAVRDLKRPKILMPPSRGAKKLAADFRSLQFRKLRG